MHADRLLTLTLLKQMSLFVIDPFREEMNKLTKYNTRPPTVESNSKNFYTCTVYRNAIFLKRMSPCQQSQYNRLIEFCNRRYSTATATCIVLLKTHLTRQSLPALSAFTLLSGMDGFR